MLGLGAMPREVRSFSSVEERGLTDLTGLPLGRQRAEREGQDTSDGSLSSLADDAPWRASSLADLQRRAA